MCRLFAMSGGREPVQATFWLLEAPDSLARQSRREPDGTGLGSYDTAGDPVISKQPVAAFQDARFHREAKDVSSRTFVAHVRYASTGSLSLENTHPFQQRGRVFAHNGVVGGLDRLEQELGDAMSLVTGQTDSERLFALITRETERTGDVGEGIASAARWVAENLPLFAINLVLIDASDLWALRYPDTHDLLVLERSAGGPGGHRHLEHSSPRASIRVRSGDLASRPAVVVATEQMDEDCGWRPLASGELLHVDGDLTVTVRQVLDAPPAHPLTLADLGERAAASQSPQAAS
ncbi:MAG TPA: class II glutamine amidotransferase [Solirubrobacteraceae bacterium]|jgi:glutamine amidotransferase|nr:class II glutamine amidotransferase [Solirubrobacteraceae bacterium]